MNWNDYILTITTSVLKTKETELHEKLEYIGKTIQTDVLRAPKSISVGAQSDGGPDYTFNEWTHFLFAETIKKIDIINFKEAGKQLPDHILAAFAGGHNYVLQVITEKKIRAYLLRMEMGPIYNIAFEQLIELIEAQDLKENLWARVVQIVNKSNEMNNLPVFEPGKMRDYFLDRKNGPPEYLLTDIVSEMQVECIALETTFRLPEHFKTNFYKSENGDFFGPDDSNRVFLMTTKVFSAVELLELINAQPFREEIWKKYEEDQLSYEQNISPLVVNKEYAQFINALSSDELSTLSYTITDVICRLCEKHKLTPIIPEHLKSHFESELEHKRVQARGNWDKWYLKPNEDNWNMYYFELIDLKKIITPERTADKGKQAFINALTEIETFAERIESNYSEAFRLSLFFMNAHFLQTNFDAEHNKYIVSELQNKGFSDQAVNVFNNKAYSLENFHQLGFSEIDVYSLFAIEIADVFGGMGSWNDEFVNDPNDYETYQKVSAELYKTMKNYFVNILSS